LFHEFVNPRKCRTHVRDQEDEGKAEHVEGVPNLVVEKVHSAGGGPGS
jgi:hypothetical protein